MHMVLYVKEEIKLIEKIIYIVLCHLFGDYVLQSDFIAKKTKIIVKANQITKKK